MKLNTTIGIAGGSGSGKTTIAKALIEALGPAEVCFIELDNYYNDLSHLAEGQRKDINFDHPDSLDHELLVQHLNSLACGEKIVAPKYNFKTHNREKNEFFDLHPQKYLIIEGILLFSQPELREILDLKVFIEADCDVRFIRRLTRDVSQRNRTMVCVIEQYLGSVKKMHDQFVEPTKEFADLIVSGCDNHDTIIKQIMDHLG